MIIWIFVFSWMYLLYDKYLFWLIYKIFLFLNLKNYPSPIILKVVIVFLRNHFVSPGYYLQLIWIWNSVLYKNASSKKKLMKYSNYE